MIHIAETMGCDADLCVVSFESGWEKLVQETRENPVGIIVSSIDDESVKEVVSSHSDYKDIKITVLDDLPMDMWILYNKVNAVYSDGA